MKIGIDIDNVLVDLNRGFCKFYNKKHEKNILPEKTEKYYLEKYLPITREEEARMWHEFFNSNEIKDIEFVENAKEAIDVLKKKHEIVFITARHLDWKNQTKEFFEKHFSNDNFEIIYSGDEFGNGLMKHNICDDLGISVLIDDHPTKTREYAENGIRVILLKQPWNVNIFHKNIIKADNWKQILEEIERLKE